MNTRRGGVCFLVVVLVIVPLTVSASAGALGVGGPTASVQSADNQTEYADYHQNPDEYEGDGDLAGLEGWLGERLDAQLRESSIELSEGDADRAREHVGEEYREQLALYVEVSSETGGESDAEAFEETRDRQEELIDTVETYRETKADYEDARERGDDEEARELARELETLSEEIETHREEVETSYAQIDREDEDTELGVDSGLAAIQAEVESDQTAVREEQFLETELTIEPSNGTISYLDPLTGTGTLETTNDAAIANQEIELEIEDRNYTVETDSDGTFEFEYRPRSLSATADNVSIRYTPSNQSEYLGSETTVPVSVEQTELTVSDLEVPANVSYGDNVSVQGTVTAEGEAVDDIPLVLILAGQELDEVQVSDGSFNGTVTVPASVPDGDQEAGVRLPYDDSALASMTETDTVVVHETETTLSMGTEEIDEETVHINGTLETVDEIPVEEATVQIRVADAPVDTLETDSEGEFEETVTVPSTADGSVSLVVEYDGVGTNLASTSDETTITVGEDTSDTWTETLISARGWLGAAVLVASVLIAGTWWSRRSSSRAAVFFDGALGFGSTTEADHDPSTGVAVRALLTHAEEQLTEDHYSRAVQVGYAAVRHSLSTEQDRHAQYTHWEFYEQQIREQPLESEDKDRLQYVIEGYERATFDEDGITQAEAKAILEKATQLCARNRLE